MKLQSVGREKGVVMIAILVLILVGMIVGFAMLMSSRTSIRLSSDFRGKTTLYYKAEEGINKTLAQFINDSPYGENYALGGFDKYTGPVTCDTAMNPLVPEGSSGSPNSIRCDFYGNADSIDDKGFKLQVMVSRRPDHCKNGTNLAADPSDIRLTCENEGDSTDGQVYLVNSVATDSAGRQELTQGVIIIPMIRTVLPRVGGGTEVKTIRHPYLVPYLAALVRGGSHKSPDVP